MSDTARGALFLSGGATAARQWVRRGVVPCHVIDHPTWATVVPAAASAALSAPYDDPLMLLASRQVTARLAPAVGLFLLGDVAAITATAAGRSTTRWALRDAERTVVAGPALPALSPEDLHRALGSGGSVRPVPVREVRDLWARTDLPHDEWLIEVSIVLGLPGAQIIRGVADGLGPALQPDPRAMSTFESVVKDVHQ